MEDLLGTWGMEDAIIQKFQESDLILVETCNFHWICKDRYQVSDTRCALQNTENLMRKDQPNTMLNNLLPTDIFNPGAFTVLPPENDPPPDPPSAPQPYRLTPSARRHKNMSFAILAEATPGSRPGSRSPSPTGRVSPFRGRGFNPAGSRHASPGPSPPPGGERIQSSNHSSPHRSKIPKLTRKGSISLFGEKVEDHGRPSPRQLGSHLSQSLNNLTPKKVSSSSSNRPPPSPRKPQGSHAYTKAPAFQRLSPIVGSSPEPTQSQSSPATKSRSQPQSRFSSPSRKPQNSSRTSSRPVSKPASRNPSREPSPGNNTNNGNAQSPARAASRNHYRNIQAKVNSFHKVNKPKVPLKSQVISEKSEETTTSDDNAATNLVNNRSRNRLQRKESVNSRLRTNSKSNVISKSVADGNSQKNTSGTKNNNNSSNNDSVNKNKDTNRNSSTNKSGIGNSHSDDKGASATNPVTNASDKKSTETSKGNVSSTTSTKVETSDRTSNSETEIVKKSESSNKLAELLQPSTTTVVSSTTTTVTQPLKIDAKIDQSTSVAGGVGGKGTGRGGPGGGGNSSKSDTPVTTRANQQSALTKRESSSTLVPSGSQQAVSASDNRTISPMVDGRVLSATSVSNAMNKMNDTVLDTQTLIKDHGMQKISPAASTIIAMSNEIKNTTPALDVTIPDTVQISQTTEGNNGVVSSTPRTVTGNSGSNNHVTTTGIVPARVIDQHVQNNMSKLIMPENAVRVGNSVQKSVNDRMKEARTMVADDVKPIKILVKERPMNVEVQSGNVRISGDVANGISERPSLPPSNNASNDSHPPQEPQEDPTKQNVCGRFFTACKNKLSCKKPNALENEGNTESHAKAPESEADNQRKGCFPCKKKKKPDVTINIEEDEPKQGCWDKIKCCGKHRVRDSQCFPTGKRKDSWVGRQDSILSDPPEKLPWFSRANCKNMFRKMLCMDRCCKSKKRIAQERASRRASMMSKKKSLTPSVPQEDHSPKLDMSLVEHSSPMKGAIPVLPVGLAWFCLVMNCIAPGTGTIFSGLFCLCFGIPRFSQKDGAKQRFGAFLIDLIIGFGQFFTVLFCLVGWGWSIWWGVIMLKVAKKHKKIKQLEETAQKTEEQQATRQVPVVVAQNHHATRDPERGS